MGSKKQFQVYRAVHNLKLHHKHHFMQAIWDKDKDKGAGRRCNAYQNLMQVVARLAKQHAAAKHITQQ
jgi:hypothetical protein